MSTLPPSADYTGASVTQGGKKTFMAAVRLWLSEAFGTDSTPATVLAALGGLAKAGGVMTGLLTLAKGANIVSASTVNLSTATGNTVTITGTTGISAWTMTSGQVMDVIFAAALTLTHHATTNNLPGTGNITTAAGDRARYYYDGTTVYCLSYTKASGAAITPDVAAASQAEQEAASSTTTYVSPGRQKNHPSAAKAWGIVTFSGGATPTLASPSFGVTSITDSGTGVTTITLSTPFSSAVYCPLVTSLAGTGNLDANVGTMLAGSFVVNGRNSNTGTATDFDFAFVVFGDQ